MSATRPFSEASEKSSSPAAAVPFLPYQDAVGEEMPRPQPPYLSTEMHSPRSTESPRDSLVPGTPISERHGSETGVLLAKEEEYQQDAAYPPVKKGNRRRPLLIVLIACVVLILIAVAVVVPVYFTVIKPRNSDKSSAVLVGGPTSSGSSDSTHSTQKPTSTAGSGPPIVKEAISGGNGSTIKLANGTSFTYSNNFGGIWYSDPDDPFNNNAYPNSWTPPLNKSWNYGTDRINGVNLGGWFVLEPFISPALFQRYPDAVDEWSLSVAMRADPANGGIDQIEDHYKTFITEQDIAAIAAAGLNWIRLPIPYWAVDTWGDEPFSKASWPYIVQAIQWCRKYGLRIKLDLHTIPGSQNGYNHSGKMGIINFLMGTMGMANAQRALNYIRIITEFISQPEYRDVVPMFGIINEARAADIGKEELGGFYMEAYRMIRGITGVGAGNGPYISIHDAFQGLQYWVGLMPGADRVVIDQHPYFAFDVNPRRDPIDVGTGPDAGGTWPAAACNRWASNYNTSRAAFGVTIAGEFSNALNGCGLFVQGVKGPSSAACAPWMDSSNWTDGTKAGLLAFSKASMDAMRDYFFWTWKVGADQNGVVAAPLWSYSLGLAGGWMPTDPRSAIGACGPGDGPIFDQTFQPWMTGDGSGTIPAANTALYPYPPTSLQGTPVEGLPLYTSAGAISTLAPPTYTGTGSKTISGGNGWFNPNDAQPAPTPISGCTYPDPWDAQDAAIPTGCTGNAEAAPALITPPPSHR